MRPTGSAQPCRPSLSMVLESNIGLECFPAGNFQAAIHENLPPGSIVEQVDGGLGKVEYQGPVRKTGPPGKTGSFVSVEQRPFVQPEPSPFTSDCERTNPTRS